MITSIVPTNWQALQLKVGRILSECGFSVKVEEKVRTVRGEVEVDVYAVEDLGDRKYTIVCECKHWKRPVPQTIVHGFRTVVSEMGANAGYIVSLAGHQAGAFSASTDTNIELVTWEGFQSKFQRGWLESFFCPSLASRLTSLFCYTDPLVMFAATERHVDYFPT